jgi:hypothetical protein
LSINSRYNNPRPNNNLRGISIDIGSVAEDDGTPNVEDMDDNVDKL